jgi:hypothetical protein
MSTKRRSSKLFFFLLLLLGGGFFLGIASLHNLTEETPILTICVTGNIQIEQMEYKHPDSPLKQMAIPCHEVILKTLDGSELSHLFLPGDLVGIRAKIFRFPLFFNALGIKTKYRLDLIYSGYRRAEDYSRFPVRAVSLNASSSWLFKQWESFFTKNAHLFFIKTATLESHYFPLSDETGAPLTKEFILHISSFGLS